MDPILIIITTVLSIVVTAVAIFLIILLVRLSSLVKNSEKTVTILNSRLPDSLDRLNGLIDHSEDSLNKLDETLRQVQEPIDNFKELSQAGTKIVGGFKGKGGGQIISQLVNNLSGNLSRILVGAISGGVVTLLKKLLSGQKKPTVPQQEK